MTAATLPERTLALDRELVKVARPIKVLSRLGWPIEVGERFIERWQRGERWLPVVDYPRAELVAPRTALEAIMARCERNDPVENFLHRTARSYVHATHMVESIGTPAFSTWSARIYGTPRDPVAVGNTTTRMAAERLMEITRDYVETCRPTADDYCIAPETVAEELRRAATVFDRHRVEIVVDPTLTAKAAAGAERIRIRGATCFSAEDVGQLIEHELFVHTLTVLNGRMQPQLTALSLGAPRTTRTQEGLALFAELITHSIDINRLRRIASRCVAIDMALSGADFIDVFEYFVGCDQTPQESFSSAQRVFRGGDVRGGVAFTKDTVYLQGFVRVHSFLRNATLDGRVEKSRRLVAGRLRTSDVALLEPAFDSGALVPPMYEPRWLQRRSTLVAFLLHSAFVHELQLDAVLRAMDDDGK